jgi:hypothetical protein
MSQQLPEHGSSESGRSLYKILFLCEDWSAGQKAKKLRNALANNCREHMVLETRFYYFAGLCHPEIRERAKRQVSESDMFIVCSNGSAGLPLFVQNWLNEFSPEDQPLACAEFFEPGIFEPFSPNFMEDWSKKNGIEFFSNRESNHQKKPATQNPLWTSLSE